MVKHLSIYYVLKIETLIFYILSDRSKSHEWLWSDAAFILLLLTEKKLYKNSKLLLGWNGGGQTRYFVNRKHKKNYFWLKSQHFLFSLSIAKYYVTDSLYGYSSIQCAATIAIYSYVFDDQVFSGTKIRIHDIISRDCYDKEEKEDRNSKLIFPSTASHFILLSPWMTSVKFIGFSVNNKLYFSKYEKLRSHRRSWIPRTRHAFKKNVRYCFNIHATGK